MCTNKGLNILIAVILMMYRPPRFYELLLTVMSLTYL